MLDTVAVTAQIESHTPVAATPSSRLDLWVYVVVGTIALFAIGTWLVWFSAHVQRRLAEEDVRAACHRVMPEAAQRCFDTVVIQRGGMRR